MRYARIVTAGMVLCGGIQMPAVGITINIEYTNEGDTVPHDENPSWDPDGTILKAHFQAAKQIWESLLPGEGEIDFDFQWDDDIGEQTFGQYNSGIDDYIEINPLWNWFADPTPLDSSEFNTPVQTLYSQVSPELTASHFPATAPPGALEVGYRATGNVATTVVGIGGFDSIDGYDLLSTVLHEMGHALGLSGVEPGNYNILPQHLGGLEGVEVLEGGGGHLAGQGLVPYLMCESCGVQGIRRYATATDILVIAEELDMTQVRLDRVGSATSGVWSSGNTWIGGAVPGATQDVYIASIGNVDLDTNASVRNLTIGATEALDVEAHSLTVAKTLKFDGAALSVGTGGTILADKLNGSPVDLTAAVGSMVRFNQFSRGSSSATTASFAGNVAIGHGTPTDGTVTLASPITNWTIAENLTIGDTRSVIVPVGNGSAWNVGGNLTVGSYGGELQIQSGGTVSVGGSLQVSGGEGVNVVKVAPGSTLNVVGQISVGTAGRVEYTGANPHAAAINVGGGATSVIDVPYPGSDYERYLFGGEVTLDGTTVYESLSTPINVNAGTGNSASGGKLTFKGNAKATSYQIVNQGGLKGPSLNYGTRSGLGGETRFEGTSSASTANIRNDPVLDDRGGSGGHTIFADHSTASAATINNYGTTTAYVYRPSGTTEFLDSSTASFANITNHPTNAYEVQDTSLPSYSGRTFFSGASTAGAATITNLAGTAAMQNGGRTIFRGSSTAANATIVNFGTTQYAVGMTEFRENSTAGTANVRLKTGWSRVDFRDNASAGDAEFIFENGPAGGWMNFYNNSKAGTAQFTWEASANGSVSYFYDNSSAEQANFVLKGNSSKLRFQGNSTAAQATFDIAALTQVQFGSNSTPADATFNVHPDGYLDISGAGVTANNPIINLDGALVANGASAGLGVSSYASAGNAVITIGGGNTANAPGAYASFDYSGRAQNATIIVASGTVPGAKGGNLTFRRGGNGENVRVINQQGGLVDINANKGYIKTTMGSIEGAGTILLSGAELETGSRNTNDTISGPIIDITSYGLGGKLTKVGTGTLTLSGVNTYTGLTTVDAGTVVVNGSNVGGAIVNSGATLAGTGSLGGTVNINAGGTLAPGTTLGTLTVGGLTLAGGTLAMEIGGTAAGTQYDQVSSSGAFSLAGALNVSLANGFAPSAGQSFNLLDWGSLSGTFSSMSLPTLSGLTWNTSQLYTNGVLSVASANIPGDYNNDSAIDAADYVVWRKSGINGPTGYDTWRTHFGEHSSSGSGASANATVPEPATLVMLIVAAAVVAIGRQWQT
jgi:autotransporter-associated beta strand protein/T5SS/PEP-CTERM-associated repeat protein